MFGDAAEAARDFDDDLRKVKDLFFLPNIRSTDLGWTGQLPCRLQNVADRTKAREIISRMQLGLQIIQSKAPQSTMIVAQRLNELFIEPMSATVENAREMASAEFPEYTLGTRAEFAQKVFTLLDYGKIAETQTLISEANDKFDGQLGIIAEKFGKLTPTAEYVTAWRRYLSGVDYWQDWIADEREELEKKFARIAGKINMEELAPKADASPHDKAIMALDPAEFAKCRWRKEGNYWSMGVKESGGTHYLVFAIMEGSRRVYESYAEVQVDVNLPPDATRLGLNIVCKVYQDEEIYIDREIPELCRFLEVYADSKKLASFHAADADANGYKVIELAGITGPTKLKIRAVNSQSARHYNSIIAVGPVRILP